MKWLRRSILAALALLLAGLALDRLFPVELGRLARPSLVVADRDGEMLRAFIAADGAWRLPARADAVDPLYLDMLLAYEDRRFMSHPGVDPLAVGRALLQWGAQGRVVSGASTLTMQVARLLEPRPRGFTAKLLQMARAWQLELHHGKTEILEAYLALAPFGGNIEGVRAASLAYFGKEPRRLTEAEAALLVALPRAPERFRPDRFPAAALAARNVVLARAAAEGVIDEVALRRALAVPVPTVRLPMPFLAPHLAERVARAADPQSAVIATTLDAGLQAAVEAEVVRRASGFEPEVGAAAILLHNPTMELRAYVGAPDYFDARRHGMIDMATAVRSPGSTLKPFIYGLGFDRLIIHPDTLIADRPSRFGGYVPVNFDGGYRGEVTVREALQRSLNVPAVAVLDRIGAAGFDAALRRAGIALRFDRTHGAASLPLALGGVGLTLEELVRLYAALANGGELRSIARLPGEAVTGSERLMGPAAAWYTAQILEGVAPPSGHAAAGAGAGPAIAFKTGTSYGFRDAWAIGIVGDHTIGVWVGRADGTPCLDCIGIEAAAPILFALADLLPPSAAPRRAVPAGVIAGPASALPPSLRRFAGDGSGGSARQPGPAIIFPVDGTRLKVERDDDGLRALALRAEGGARPLRWLVNGAPVESTGRRSAGTWLPDGPGYVRIEVIDAAGRSAAAEVFIEAVADR
jgi:penicillin-binding protein 1C